jgi:hypothetical protein
MVYGLGCSVEVEVSAYRADLLRLALDLLAQALDLSCDPREVGVELLENLRFRSNVDGSVQECQLEVG